MVANWSVERAFHWGSGEVGVDLSQLATEVGCEETHTTDYSLYVDVDGSNLFNWLQSGG